MFNVKKLLICAFIVVGLFLGSLIAFNLWRKRAQKSVPVVEQVEIEESAQELMEDMIPRPVLLPKLEAAQEKNKDVVAWIYVPGTNIDFPVMQSDKDYTRQSPREEFYLHHDENGKRSLSGSIYTHKQSVLSSRESLSRNLWLNGHSMEEDMKKNAASQRMFAQVHKFFDARFAFRTPYFFIAIPGEVLVYKVFAVFITEVPYRKHSPPGAFLFYSSDFPRNSDGPNFKGGDGSGPAPLSPESGLSWTQVLANEAKLRSLYNYEDVPIGPDDKVGTLSTCTYEYGSTGSANCETTACVVQGILISRDEKLRDKARLRKNPNPKPPQGLPNPSVKVVYEAHGDIPDDIAESEGEAAFAG
ncbi:MAG: class B sortase [Oscillospiraceae bacterium]|jgi:sortase B|nr:class B sortase [Oscillospiraceae bacterium]